MHAYQLYDAPVIEDLRPNRLRTRPRQRRDLVPLGQARQPSLHATGPGDLGGRILIDMVEGNRAAVERPMVCGTLRSLPLDAAIA